MDEIKVKTRKAFDTKWKEIEGHFRKANPNWDGSFHPNNPRFRTLFEHKRKTTIIYCPPGYRGEITSYPRKYPEGITLVLVKKCQYCSGGEVITETATWQSRDDRPNPNIGMIGGRSPALIMREKIRELNPGICQNCVDRLYREYLEEQSKGKGFWDSFFG